MELYRIKHLPTGLFYCSRKGRWLDKITNLSEKGEFYLSEKIAQKVLKEDAKRAFINDAQKRKYSVETIEENEFKVIKYELIEL